MKGPFVVEIKPDQNINALFLVLAKDIRQKKSGDPFLSLTLADKTGELDAKMWDNAAEVMDTFDRDDFVKVKGLTQNFQNRLQLTIHKLQKVADADVEVADYFPASKHDPREMERELREYIAQFKNPHLKALLESVFGDERIVSAYRIAPAAKSIHHAFLSGLIEHVLSMAKVAKFTAAHYADIDVDLLLTGVFLHDIGKIYELTYHRGFGYSDEGQLIGHIIMGYQMVTAKAAAIPEFPPKLLQLVQHLILSHHGQLEYGSPKVPLFPEALLLHHIDNLDSKMEAMRWTLERDTRIDGNWTAYSAALERVVLKKSRYMDETPTPAPQTPAQGLQPAASPATPHAQPQPQQHQHQHRPQQNSLFAEKLAQAIKTH
jgi:3'-5' exoribonuclease